MKVVITGGSGFIGRHLGSHMVSAGHDVLSVDDHRSKPLGDPFSAEIRVAVEDLEAHQIGDADIVYHLASHKNVPESFTKPLTYLQNAAATKRILDLVKELAIPRLIVGSTCEVYGDTGLEQIPENQPLQPLSPYAASKAIGDLYAAAYREVSEGSICIARIFNTYGPYERPDAVVPAMCSGAALQRSIRIEGDGSQRRDFTYIDDMVSKLGALATVQEPPPIINLGSGSSVTMSQVADIVELECGFSVSRVGASPRRNEISNFCSSADLQRRLGIYPTSSIGLTDGVRATYNWWSGSQMRGQYV